MRIVQFFTRVGQAQGGVSRAIYDLMVALAASGHDVTLLTSVESDFPKAWDAQGGDAPRVVTLDLPWGPLELLSRPSLERVTDELRAADVLHLHGLWRLPNTQVARVARRLETPYVLTVHGMLDDWSMRQRPIRKRVYYSVFERTNLASASSVVTTARAEAEQARRWIPHDRVSIIPCVVDLEPFVDLPESSLFLSRRPEVDPRRRAVLYLGRLHPKKGVETLIGAIVELRNRGVDCQLLIAGTGEPAYVEAVRRLADRRLGDALFLDLVTGEEKLALYRFADVLALPTKHENFGLVLAESLACGTPVVTTRGTAIWRELTHSGAALVVESTATAFADALSALLLDEPRRREMGSSGRQWVFEWLAPPLLIDRIEQLYREALSA